MAIPELTKRSAERLLAEYCEQRVSMRERMRLLEHMCRGNDLTLVEREVPWPGDIGEEWSRRVVMWGTRAASLRPIW